MTTPAAGPAASPPAIPAISSSQSSALSSRQRQREGGQPRALIYPASSTAGISQESRKQTLQPADRDHNTAQEPHPLPDTPRPAHPSPPGHHRGSALASGPWEASSPRTTIAETLPGVGAAAPGVVVEQARIRPCPTYFHSALCPLVRPRTSWSIPIPHHPRLDASSRHSPIRRPPAAT